jgi:hypothetical protein
VARRDYIDHSLEFSVNGTIRARSVRLEMFPTCPRINRRFGMASRADHRDAEGDQPVGKARGFAG